MKSSMTLVNFAVLATTSAWSSPVRINSTAGSKRRMYLRSFESHTVKPGTTAASVRRAMRARPLAVQAGMPKKSTNTPCGGGHVGVHEDADGFAGAHGGEQAADEIVFVDGAVPMHGAVALDEGVDVGIVEGAHDDRQRIAMQRMSEGGELPGA